VERDELGRVKFLGYVLQFGGWSLYHSGDTLRYDGMAEKLRPSAVDVALLPINGRAPERRVAGNLSGSEAAELAYDIGAKLVIPCHYDMFEFNTAPPDAFADTCRRLGQPFRILRCGERFESPAKD
jgi:L-ascorbate metabolism protein UlaG (beta-lactamase superfamily)